MDNVSYYTNDDGETVKKSTSHKAIIFRDGKLLMVQNEHSGELCIPGGRDQVGESPEEALVREIREETGYKAVKILSATIIHEDSAIFRWHEDNGLRHIDKKWYFCEVEISDESEPPSVVWATYDLANSALIRASEKLLLQKVVNNFT